MYKFLVFFFFTATALKVNAQNSLNTDSGAFIVHKFENPIGTERYTVLSKSDKLIFDIDFNLSDRGTPEHLRSKLVLSLSGEPVSLAITGATSNASHINDTIRIINSECRIKIDSVNYKKYIRQPVFPIAGCVPGTLQQELLNYWKRQHRPPLMNTLPYGAVRIACDGLDTVHFNGRPLLLQRYLVNGLVWGNEFLWTDTKGRLAGLLTNDVTGDKLEIMRDRYESLLPQLIKIDAIAGTRKLAETGAKSFIATKVIAITGATLIDVTGKANIPNSVIIVENGMITATGKMGNVPIPVAATVIDARGKFVLPGLWDMHAHFGQAEWGPAYLAAGVTTVRDCTDEPEYINPAKKAMDENAGIGPEVLKAGLLDGKGPKSLGLNQVDHVEDAVRAVDQFKKDGYTQIKIYSQVKPAIVKAICQAAHQASLTVTGHIPDGMTLQQGVDSGMDMVNHIYYAYASMKLNKDHSINFEDPASKAAIKFIQEHHTVIDPTIGSMELVLRSAKDSITRIEPEFYTFPQALQFRIKATSMEQAMSAKYQPMYQSMIRLVKELFDAGVPIIAGSDQGFPGYSLDRELEIYVQAGLTPLQAIQSATMTPAVAMNLFDKKGSIAPGKEADLFIVDGDPTADIHFLRKVFKVLHGSRVYEPERLHQLAGFTK